MGVDKRGEEAIAFSPLFILGGIHLWSPFWGEIFDSKWSNSDGWLKEWGAILTLIAPFGVK